MHTAITLINPPSAFLTDDRVFPNIGLLKIATELEKFHVDVRILDLSGQKAPLALLRRYLADNPHCQCYGISATTPQLPICVEIAKEIRKHGTGRVILGGAHSTLVNAARKWEVKNDIQGRGHSNFALLAEHFDVIVAGDGEKAIFPALQRVAPALIDADDRLSPYFVSSSEFAISQIASRKFIELGSYGYAIDGLPATSLITQLGCPFNCAFCGGRHSAMLRGSRMRNIDLIIEEIRYLHETYGYTGFMFYDDELNIRRNLPELLQELIRLQYRMGTHFAFRGFVKSELFTEEQARLMVDAGFKWLLSGFESGSSRMLLNMNKTASLADNTKSARIAKKYGLKVKALMSIGHAGESLETLKETEDWLYSINPDDFDITIITPYPGSSYFDESIQNEFNKKEWIYTAKETKDKLYSIEIDYATITHFYKGDPDYGYRSYVYTDYLSCDDLVLHRDAMEQRLRKKLGIARPANPAMRDYEHSMGQTIHADL